jgi:hypothetical protein
MGPSLASRALASAKVAAGGRVTCTKQHMRGDSGEMGDGLGLTGLRPPSRRGAGGVTGNCLFPVTSRPAGVFRPGLSVVIFDGKWR